MQILHGVDGIGGQRGIIYEPHQVIYFHRRCGALMFGALLAEIFSSDSLRGLAETCHRALS